MTKKQSGKGWSRSFGEYGCGVRVYESRGKGSVLHAEIRSGGRSKKTSLGHRNRDRAIWWARQKQARVALRLSLLQDVAPTVGRVSSLYMEHQSPNRGVACQQHDARCAELWRTVLGEDKDLYKLTKAEWQKFTKLRTSGAIDPRGNEVPESKRHPVRVRAVGNDLEWLRGIILWAMTWQDEDGNYIMSENPARGYKIPKEKNPLRPVATHDRYEKTRAVSDRVMMEVSRDGKRVKVRSYLSQLLDIANGTGRRISAILKLQYADLRLEKGPQGSIRWPQDTDKEDKEWLTPINASVRHALDAVLSERQKAGVLSPYLFPSPLRPKRPVSKDLASEWLEKAEALAELSKLKGSPLWHAYRRKWATERKGLPDKDVAAAGGWSDLTSLKTAYQQVDTATLYRVVSEPAELREVK